MKGAADVDGDWMAPFLAATAHTKATGQSSLLVNPDDETDARRELGETINIVPDPTIKHMDWYLIANDPQGMAELLASMGLPEDDSK